MAKGYRNIDCELLCENGMTSLQCVQLVAAPRDQCVPAGLTTADHTRSDSLQFETVRIGPDKDRVYWTCL
jgi:hypothetical protein